MKNFFVSDNETNAYAEKLLHYSFHSNSSIEMKAELVQVKPLIQDDDYLVLKKIKEIYYNNAQSFKSEDKADIWQNYIIPKHKNFLNHLKNNDDDAALSFLNNMFSNDAGYGFVSPLPNPDSKKSNDAIKLLHMDSLVNFAEWLGVIPVENYEQNVWGNSVCMDPDYIIDLIEKKLGFEIKFPAFYPGLFGIKTKRGVFFYRDFIYLYIALKVQEYCSFKTNPSILEIGGGAGLLAYYCNMLCLKNVSIVDIPTVNLISAYFLMKNLPEREFLFNYDETKYTNDNSIKLLIPESFHDAPDNQYDITINCDSLPEVNAIDVEKYLSKMTQTSSLFYSINQEAGGEMWGLGTNQNIIPAIIEKTGGFTRKSRNLFWLRRGYVEELYKIN